MAIALRSTCLAQHLVILYLIKSVSTRNLTDNDYHRGPWNFSPLCPGSFTIGAAGTQRKPGSEYAYFNDTHSVEDCAKVYGFCVLFITSAPPRLDRSAHAFYLQLCRYVAMTGHVGDLPFTPKGKQATTRLCGQKLDCINTQMKLWTARTRTCRPESNAMETTCHPLVTAAMIQTRLWDFAGGTCGFGRVLTP